MRKRCVRLTDTPTFSQNRNVGLTMQQWYIVWGAAPSQGEEGSGTTSIRALFQCPECGHDQSDHSVV